MLGRKNLQQWLQVTLLADMNAAPRAQELVRLSVIRARFFQILAEAGQAPLGPDAMFLLGFFSLLDGILDQPMEAVLAELPLDPAVQAILVDPASPHAPWLLLAQELDRCHWPGVRAQTEVLGLPLAQVGAAYHEAMVWTDAMLGAGE
jgi:EAL and modified HD-GYP domain-containing signal transduction protein